MRSLNSAALVQMNSTSDKSCNLETAEHPCCRIEALCEQTQTAVPLDELEE